MVNQEITHKPFSSCLEDDPFNDQDHYKRLVIQALILFSFQAKKPSFDTRSVLDKIVHSTKLYHGTGYGYHFSLTKLYVK